MKNRAREAGCILSFITGIPTSPPSPARDRLRHGSPPKEAHIGLRFLPENTVDTEKEDLCPPQEKSQDFRAGL